MKSRIAMLAGVAAAALASSAAIASPAAADPIPHAESYADLLEPVPDAMQRLQVHDELVGAPAAQVQTVQYWRDGRDRYDRGDRDRGRYEHHHHHHSSRWYRSHGYGWSNGGWYQGRPRYEHHHHHHHNQHWNGGYR
jgi:hypothetical protein